MKLKKYVAVFTAAAIFAACTPVYAAQWVEAEGGEWYYVDDNGQKLRNTVSEDGYCVDFWGKCVPLKKTEGTDRDREISSNLYYKYLETGDPKYLTGSEYITPNPFLPELENGAQYPQNYNKYYVDYLSCINGYSFRPTIYKLSFRPSSKPVYPDYYLNKLKQRTETYPNEVLDANNAPLYYSTHIPGYISARGFTLYDDGDFTPLANAKKRGIQIFDYTTNSGEARQVLSQRDAYKLYKEFLDAAAVGTDNMSERELALHFLEIVKNHLTYSSSVLAADDKTKWMDRDIILTILAGSGVCGNYADLYQLLCDAAGLECRTETGLESGEPHAWNLVRVDGTWYHVDATWADTIARYDGLLSKCRRDDPENCELIKSPAEFQ